jgi:phosphatidylserine decarboxylase
MFIDRAGLPFIGAAVVLAIAAGFWFGRGWSIPFLVLAAFFVFFFRDPDRNIPTSGNLVVSPADARIMAAGERTWPGAPPGEWQVVSMFLSPLDVHVNRTPVDGTVTRVEYHPGQFLPAYRKEAGQLIAPAVRSSPGRSSACSPGASSAACRWATRWHADSATAS